VLGDPAQDFIVLKEFELGEARETNFRAFDSAGTERSGPCTIANLQVGGGDAQGKKELAFEIHINGKPEKFDPLPASDLTMTLAAGSREGTVKVSATIGEKNKLAYRISSVRQEAFANSYPTGVTNYTSGNDITAPVGQFLNMFELNEYGRVIKFRSMEVTAIS
jgi:hypothetical protein